MKKLTVNQILTLGLVLQILLVKFLSHYPVGVEKFYSTGIYPWISRFFRFLFGWIPFSVGDLLYTVLIVLLIRGIYLWFKRGWKSHFKATLFRFGAYLSVFYFLFHFLWALNYHRNNLFTTLELEARPYTTDELIGLNEELLSTIKNVHQQLSTDDTLAVIVPYSKKKILKMVEQGYEQLSLQYPEFKPNARSIKKSLFSWGLSVMGFSGYLNPLTNEAQVNAKVPAVNLPMIGSHEVAHQLGIASESEANFIGYMAANAHKDLYFKYSANLLAIRYSLAALAVQDSSSARGIIERVPLGVIKNIKEAENFWKGYQNVLEPFFKVFYDNYLKANQQQDGMLGYSKMVNLLVAYREKYGLE